MDKISRLSYVLLFIVLTIGLSSCSCKQKDTYIYTEIGSVAIAECSSYCYEDNQCSNYRLFNLNDDGTTYYLCTCSN